jgi:hypothetical protein
LISFPSRRWLTSFLLGRYRHVEDGEGRGVLWPVQGQCRSSSYRNPRELLLTHRSLRHLQGSVAHVVRIAPHTVITLVANELICGQYAKLKQRFESDL